jgi:hypothetical protein
MNRIFTYKDDKSDKYWSIDIKENNKVLKPYKNEIMAMLKKKYPYSF